MGTKGWVAAVVAAVVGAVVALGVLYWWWTHSSDWFYGRTVTGVVADAPASRFGKSGDRDREEKFAVRLDPVFEVEPSSPSMGVNCGEIQIIPCPEEDPFAERLP
jgi:hypothetical protein